MGDPSNAPATAHRSGAPHHGLAVLDRRRPDPPLVEPRAFHRRRVRGERGSRRPVANRHGRGRLDAAHRCRTLPHPRKAASAVVRAGTARAGREATFLRSSPRPVDPAATRHDALADNQARRRDSRRGTGNCRSAPRLEAAPRPARARAGGRACHARQLRWAGGASALLAGELVDSFDLVAQVNDVTFDDVRAESAAVNERAKESGSREFLEMSARFSQSTADAFDRADPEALTDEAVEGDAARDDVAARLVPGELDLVEPLRLCQREVLSAPGTAEGSPARGVSVAAEPAAGNSLGLVQ